MRETKELTGNQVRSFRRTVYAYFRKHGRDLPWRRTADPYHIFVSEIMLQQTQVDRVAEKYTEFVRQFPTFEALGSAPFDKVLAAWQGLGYNRRARNLHRAAQMVVERFRGCLPRTPEQLVELPGVGPATAASIAAFAFDNPSVFIETNIRSVFMHHFFPTQSGIDDRLLLPLVDRTLDRRRPAAWYSALMDYGTMLKKEHGNPSRRSRHHVRQSPFRGSDRQIRGTILRVLLNRPRLSQASLTRELGEPRERVEGIVEQLVAEGMIVRRGRGYSIAT